MATLAIAAAGSAIGGAIGGSFLGISAASIGWAAGTLVGNALFPTKLPDQNVQGPRLSDLRIQTSAYGAMIPIVAGAKKVTGNIIWSRPIREVSTVTTSTQGGGGGGGKGGGGGGGSQQTVTTTTYNYYADFAVLLCEGTCVAIRKIWANGELIYNVGDDAASATIAASSLQATAVRFYPGSESQAVDPLIYADKGVDTPAYRGSCYVVIEGMDVTARGGRVPQMEFEVVASGSQAATLAISAGTVVSTTSVVNPSGRFLLGRNGNVWCLGAVPNTIVRLNVYASAVASSHTRTLWGYAPVAPYVDGRITYNNSGGFFGVISEDGTISEYSGAPGTLGSGGSFHGVAWLTSTTGYAQGDSSSSSNLYYFALNTTTGAVDETLLSAARSTHLFTNATAIPGRCYVYGSSTFSFDVGYMTNGNSKVLLLTGTEYAPQGLLVSRDGYLWMARQGASTNVEKRDADGNLIGSVATPAGAVSRLIEAPDGYIYAWVSTGAIYGIHPATLTIDYTSESTGSKAPLGFTEDGRLILWSQSGSNILLHEMERFARVTLGTKDLDEFVTEICARVGIEPADIDVSALGSDTITGYAIARRDSLRSALAPLQIAYRFDVVESDNVIKFVKRGGAAVADIPEDDLAARFAGQEPPAPIANVRKLETELPREVAVNFDDRNFDYQISTQYARRLTGLSDEQITVDLPLVLTSAQAAGAAEFILYSAWAERNGITIVLSREYAYLEPTDVVTLTAAGVDYLVRIVDKMESGGLITFNCVSEDVDVVDTVATGVDAPTGSTTVGVGGPAVLALLDMPLLRDIDDGPGFYAAAAGYFDGWSGAELWVSRDEGTTYERTSTSFLEPNVMGSALTVLGTFGGGNVFDESSSVQVQVFGGELSSTTSALVLAGANAAYLGGELIQFRTATLDAAGRYTLTGLLRGRKGTEQYMTTHAIGDQFVLLDLATTKRVALATADIGIPLIFKAPSFGQSVAEAAAVRFTPAGVGLKPLAPVHIRAGRTANASWDITIAWTRRARKNAEWRDYVDVPVDDTPEAYEVEIYSSAAFTTLKRTITGLTSATTTYTSAQQVTDFGTNQTTIYVKVYQVSATVGRGFAGTATINV